MPNMGFWESIRFFFTDIVDVTGYLENACFTVFVLLLDLPRKPKGKEILIIVLKAILLYGLLFAVQAFGFAIDINYLHWNGLFMTLMNVVIPTVYTLVFLRKNPPLHRFIKGSLAVSSLLVSVQMSRNLGIFAGSMSEDNTAIVTFCRTLPFLIMLIPMVVVHFFDIAESRDLPRSTVTTTILLTVTLFIISLMDNAFRPNNQDKAITYLIISFFYLLFLLVLTITYYSLYSIMKSQKEKAQMEVMATLTDAEKEAVKIDETNREELSELRHDLNNQFSYVSVLLKKGDVKEAIAFIDDVTKKKEDALHSFSHANTTISSLLNMELTKAKRMGIKMKLSVAVPPRIPLPDSVLVSLLANVIDNALEAEKASGKDDLVLVSLIASSDSIRVTTKNDINENQKKNARKLSTTKPGRGHGYGTKIIRRLAEQYDGYASFVIEEDKFITDVILYYQNREEKKS